MLKLVSFFEIRQKLKALFENFASLYEGFGIRLGLTLRLGALFRGAHGRANAYPGPARL